MLGPRDQLGEVFHTLQDLGTVHLALPRLADGLHQVELTRRQDRQARHLQRALEDVDVVLERLGGRHALKRPQDPHPTIADFSRWARLAGSTRRELEKMVKRRNVLEEERALILKYREFFSAFESLVSTERTWPNARAYHVILRAREADNVPRLRAQLRSVINDDFELLTHRLASGEIAVLLLVSSRVAERVDRLLSEAGVHELPVPRDYGGETLGDVMPAMLARLEAIPTELSAIEKGRARLAARCRHDLECARATIHDRLLEIEAVSQAVETDHAFVVEGWVPSATVGRLRAQIANAVGRSVVVEELSREEWEGEDAPVVLSNPRLFRPFETITRTFPLPRYGSIDPTPFVAVFFPMFFGLMLGDVGYGAVLAALALLLRRRSKPETVLRAVSEIAGACAAFSIIFGVLYGELLGDLGRRWLGMRPLAFDRGEAIVPFLGLAVALGVVHIALGLLLGMVGAFHRHPRQAVGRGVALMMVALIVAALLAAVEILPPGFLTPTVIALLVAFPILVIAEGIVAPIEFLATVGNILSYARIMALGTASVMLAVVANRMVGAMGSAIVGVLFGLLFHLVNFALGMFSPTIHALRLHYVEFFGKFYSPGGAQYRPFTHWQPKRGQAA